MICEKTTRVELVVDIQPVEELLAHLLSALAPDGSITLNICSDLSKEVAQGCSSGNNINKNVLDGNIFI